MILQININSGIDLFAGILDVIIGIMIGIITIAYLAGNMLNKQEWIAFAKVEFVELIKTVIILGAIIGFYYFLNTIAEFMLSAVGVSLGTGVDMITYTLILLRDILLTAVKSMVKLIEIEHQMSLFSEATGRVGPGSASLQLKLMVGADILSGTLSTLNYLLLLSVHSLNAQIIGLSLVGIATAYFFFPIGALLRMIPTTRNAGNELLAMGIVFSIIIPMLYIILITMAIDVIEMQSVNGWKNVIYEKEGEKISNKILFSFEGWVGQYIRGVEKIAILFSPYYYIVPSNIISILPKVGWILFFSVALPSFVVNVSGSIIRAVVSFLDMDIDLTFMG